MEKTHISFSTQYDLKFLLFFCVLQVFMCIPRALPRLWDTKGTFSSLHRAYLKDYLANI